MILRSLYWALYYELRPSRFYILARFSKCTLRHVIRGHSFQFTEGEPTCGLTDLYLKGAKGSKCTHVGLWVDVGVLEKQEGPLGP